MSNFIEAYSKTVGVPLPLEVEDYPTSYIPIPENYIVIFSGGEYESLKYDYYSKAISLLSPYLNGTVVIQIGIAEDKPIEGAIDYRGKSNFKQTCFIIENARMLISGDSVWTHVAGSKKVPFLTLVSITPAASTIPYYKGQYEVLESHRNQNKPSYDGNESPKTINLIKPEEVAGRIAACLGVDYDKITTQRIGYLYNTSQIDYIPDEPSPFFNGAMVACRMDVIYNLQNLISFLNLQRGAIVTASPIDLNVLTSFKGQISEIIYVINKYVPEPYIKQLHKTGLNYKLVTYCKDKELSDLKLKLFDYNQVWSRPPVDVSNIDPDWLVQSKRLYVGRGKTYLSLYHYKRNIEKENIMNIGDALHDMDFQEAFENYYIYNYAQKKENS